MNVLRALAAYVPQLADYVDLRALEPAGTLLTEVRIELHRNAGREMDRLLLQEQDQVAEALTFLDADALMAGVSEAGRAIAWASNDTWRRQRFWQPVPARRSRGLFGRRPPAADGDRPSPPGVDDPTRAEVEPGIVVADGEVGLSPAAAVASDSSLAWRLAAVAAERELPVSQGALYRLADKMAPPPDPWPVETREALVRVLLTGHAAIDALESLDQRGLMVRLIPEWAAVRNRPQRNAYHRFTVDRHLLEAAANAADLADRVDRPDLLVMGALLHDIGKGFPGDHTEQGVELIATMGRRMGFSPPRRRRAGRACAGTTCCCPTRPPGATSTTPRPSRRWPRRSATAIPSSCWAPSPRPTAWPPGRRPGAAGRPAWWPSWWCGSAAASTATAAPRRPPRWAAPG